MVPVDAVGLRVARRVSLIKCGDEALADEIVRAYLNPDAVEAELDERARAEGFAVGLRVRSGDTDR